MPDQTEAPFATGCMATVVKPGGSSWRIVSSGSWFDLVVLC